MIAPSRAATQQSCRFHDCEDLFALAWSALDDALRTHGATLPPEDYEDCRSFIFEKALELTRRYDTSRGISFTAWAYPQLRLRYIDYLRRSHGDSRHGKTDPNSQAIVRQQGNAGREEVHDDPYAFIADEEDRNEESMERFLTHLDLRFLTPQSRVLFLQVAYAMGECGLHGSTLASKLGMARSEFYLQMDILRAELVACGVVHRNGTWSFA